MSQSIIVYCASDVTMFSHFPFFGRARRVASKSKGKCDSSLISSHRLIQAKAIELIYVSRRRERRRMLLDGSLYEGYIISIMRI